MRKLKTLFAVLGCLAGVLRAEADDAAPPARSVPAPLIEWPLRDGDVWVMVGDSITEQKLYTAYLEAFARARYPKLPFVVVHSGKSGQVYIQGIIRFKNTVAAYKPTLITVNFGMNDHVKVFAGEDFQDDPRNSPQRFMQTVADLKNARLYVLSASPLLAPADYGPSVESLRTPHDPKASRERSNPINKLFADKLRLVAERNGVPFIDQMTTLQTIWAANYPRDFVATLRDGLKAFSEEPITAENAAPKKTTLGPFINPYTTRPGWANALPLPDKENLLENLAALPAATTPTALEAFRLYARGWLAQVDAANPPFVRLSGYSKSSRILDLIHPNEAGHLHMAAVILKQMKADNLVSEVVIDAKTNKLTSAKKAVVSDLAMQAGVLRFKRLDDSLPLPIDPLARPALDVDVRTPLGTPRDLFGMSRYLTTVANLPVGNYEIAIDGATVATVSAADLARGVDLGLLDKGPVFAQTQKLLAAVRADLVDALAPKTAEEIAAVVPKTLPEAQPVEHVWTVRPLK
ncbi:MAG TPA: GDSL-type esterase/lipase family protein [Abditibacteriaceae bacterium]|nr:GDSL-type esterase/lipase family protein [Abditibacteriaceae bacterium]